MKYKINLGDITYSFKDLKDLMAKATPARSGDDLAGISARSMEERVAAKMVLANLPLKTFLDEPLIPYEKDEVTRLILDTHNAAAFAPISHLTVGDFRNWLLNDHTTSQTLARIAPGITPEMAAAVSKLMRNQDLLLAAKKCRVVTKFRDTIGLPGRLSARLQPNHPTDDLKGIAASIIDGLMYGCGDAVIGINPASDSVPVLLDLNKMLDEIIRRYQIPTQSCVLTHVTTSMELINRGAPVDLVFQSIAGTEAAMAGFGVTLKMLDEAYDAVKSLKRGTVGDNCMYFETGQGSALSSNANFGVDEQTCEARCYAVARRYHPLLVNTVVGFIGPEYLYDGKQITRAGLEDHFCGKLMGVPLGCDICYTNHAEADQDDMDNLLTLLAAGGLTYIMGVPGADDIMLNYQSTSYHDGLYVRKLLGLKHAPEFEEWLEKMKLVNDRGDLLPFEPGNRLLGIEKMEEIYG
jgi:ethanolamine ammonia-lyase large subunit